MPTYQYSCTECGHFFEIVQSFSEDSLTVCPECEGRLRKVFDAVGVVFKGSGFYRNDSRASQSSAEPATSTSSNGGSTESGSGTKSEPKTSSTGSKTGSASGASSTGSSEAKTA